MQLTDETVVGWELKVAQPFTFRGKSYQRGDEFPASMEIDDPRKVGQMLENRKIRRVPITGVQVAELANQADTDPANRRAEILAGGGAALVARRPARPTKRKGGSDADQGKDDQD